MVIILSVSHHYHHHPHLAQQQNAQDTPTNATKEHLATFRVIRGGGGGGRKIFINLHNPTAYECWSHFKMTVTVQHNIAQLTELG